MRVLIDDPGYFDPGSRLGAGDGELVVVNSRPHKNTLLVLFEGVVSRNDAEALRGIELIVDGEGLRELEENEFWPDDLIGFAVHAHGERIGEVVGVIPGEAQDRLVVEKDGGEIVEIPFVHELVPEVLPDSGLIRIAPIDGLV